MPRKTLMAPEGRPFTMSLNQAMLDITADRELTGLELKTMLTIQAAANADGIARLSAEKLSQHMGYSRTEVNKAITRLIEKGMIRRVKAACYAVDDTIAESMNSRRSSFTRKPDPAPGDPA